MPRCLSSVQSIEEVTSHNKVDNVAEKNDNDAKGKGEGLVMPENIAFGHGFKDYNERSERNLMVEEFYRKNHIYQTYEFATKKREEYAKLDKAEMSIWECCELLSQYIDESDPDLDEPQIQHLLQSAEAIRRDYPDGDWLHLTALIHDLGKVLLHPSFGEQPQWSVVGDTFPLGCAFDESIVHHRVFEDNPDFQNPKFNTKLGVYSENCGLDKVPMSWGHDEYMYLVAQGNNTTLPPAALFIIRFHSFYCKYDLEHALLMTDTFSGWIKMYAYIMRVECNTNFLHMVSFFV
ncbi:hypothetical protein CDL15_Pgr013152 [Punica granatum]|uniref:Inositol oxygenase n=1 Tax=Punica granatum TaxID=22663 RepID=A0A218WFH2_PUNGR|nr:hypothetical protein CDL15_Pgr013152 [Punica granatum]